MKIIRVTKRILVYSSLIYLKNFAESIGSTTNPIDIVPIVVYPDTSIAVSPCDSNTSQGSSGGDNDISESVMKCLLNSADLHSEEHYLEFTGGARCIEIRCYGELVWQAENENQGKSFRLRRKNDNVEIEDRGTGELKQTELGNKLLLNFFALGCKNPIDKSKYEYKKMSDKEGIFTFNKGVQCIEVRGNGLVVWKAAKGDRCARSVSYYGTRQLCINFSDDVHVYNRKDCKWVKEGKEEVEDVQPQAPQTPPLII